MCPAISKDQDDHFLSKSECTLIVETQSEGIKNYGTDPLMAFYIVLTQSIGLYKLDRILY